MLETLPTATSQPRASASSSSCYSASQPVRPLLPPSSSSHPLKSPHAGSPTRPPTPPLPSLVAPAHRLPLGRRRSRRLVRPFMVKHRRPRSDAVHDAVSLLSIHLSIYPRPPVCPSCVSTYSLTGPVLLSFCNRRGADTGWWRR